MKIIPYKPFEMLGVECLSDMEIDEANNSWAVEWDGMWGKHWQCFTSEKEMIETLDKNAKYNALSFVKDCIEKASKKSHFLPTMSVIKEDWKFDVKVEARKLIQAHNDLMGSIKKTEAATYTMGDLLSKFNFKFD